MSFVIAGIDPAPFAPYFDMDDETLTANGARFQIADAKPGFPCRVSLDDAEAGERVLLTNFESHKSDGPYRSAYAIYLRETAKTRAIFEDVLPPVFIGRPIALRKFQRPRRPRLRRSCVLARHPAHCDRQSTSPGGRRLYSCAQRRTRMFLGRNPAT